MQTSNKENLKDSSKEFKKWLNKTVDMQILMFALIIISNDNGVRIILRINMPMLKLKKSPIITLNLKLKLAICYLLSYILLKLTKIKFQKWSLIIRVR